MHQFNPTIPEAFEQIVRKAMAKYPDQRFQTANEMGRALEMAFHGLDTSEITAIPSRSEQSDALPVASSPATGAGLSIGDRLPRPPTSALTAQLDESPSQTVPIAAPAGASLKKYIWIFGGLGLLTGILLTLFFFWRIESTPDVPLNLQVNVIEEATPIPKVPPDLLLNQIPNGDEIMQSLGEQQNRYPRQPYARQFFTNGMMYWWDNPDAPTNAIIVVYGHTQAGNRDK